MEMNNQVLEKDTSEKKQAAELFVSISGKINAINLTKDVVRLLGIPAYVCLKVNKAMDSFIVMPGVQDEYMSFKVPEGFCNKRHVNMRMISRSFIYELMRANHLDTTQTYRIDGVYSERNNAVIFHMDECSLFENTVEK